MEKTASRTQKDTDGKRQKGTIQTRMARNKPETSGQRASANSIGTASRKRSAANASSRTRTSSDHKTEKADSDRQADTDRYNAASRREEDFDETKPTETQRWPPTSTATSKTYKRTRKEEAGKRQHPEHKRHRCEIPQQEKTDSARRTSRKHQDNEPRQTKSTKLDNKNGKKEPHQYHPTRSRSDQDADAEEKTAGRNNAAWEQATHGPDAEDPSSMNLSGEK